MGKKKEKDKSAKEAKKHEKSKKAKKLKKAKVRNKELALESCPCCSKHCPLSKPKCSKGKKLAAKLYG